MGTPPKAVYISKYTSYLPYGMESRQIYLSREWVKRGYEVNVYASTANHQLTTPPTPGMHQKDGIHIHWVPTRAYHNVYGIARIWSWFDFEWQLYKQLRKTDFTGLTTVMVSTLSLLSIFNGLYLKRKYTAKLILEVRDIWPRILTDLTRVTSRHPFYKFLAWVEKIGYTHADVIIGTMANLSEHVQTRVTTQVPVLHIPHLINDSIQYAARHDHQTQLVDIRAKGFTHILAYSGGIIGKSVGLKHLLASADELAKAKVAIVILGNGPLKQRYRQEFPQTSIFFVDRIPQDQVLAFLKDCDILYDGYIKSDIYQFGSSRNKYVEYCLAAKPLLVAYAGYPLFIEEHACGKVVEPENAEALIDAVKEMLALSPAERQAMGDNAYRYAQNHLNIPTHLDTLLFTLKQLDK